MMKAQIVLLSMPGLSPHNAEIIVKEMSTVLKKYSIEPIIVTGDIKTISRKEFLKVVKDMKR